MRIPTTADIITATDTRGQQYYQITGEMGAWDTRGEAEAWVAKVAAKRSNPTTPTHSCHYCGLPLTRGECRECGTAPRFI